MNQTTAQTEVLCQSSGLTDVFLFKDEDSNVVNACSVTSVYLSDSDQTALSTEELEWASMTIGC